MLYIHINVIYEKLDETLRLKHSFMIVSYVKLCLPYSSGE